MTIISDEEVFNKKELIKILKRTNTEENEEIYIKDIDTNEYKRIQSIRIDDVGDLIFEVMTDI